MGPRFGQKLDEKFVFFAPLLDPPKDPIRDPRGCRARHPDRPARGRRPGRPAGGPDGPIEPTASWAGRPGRRGRPLCNLKGNPAGKWSNLLENLLENLLGNLKD